MNFFWSNITTKRLVSLSGNPGYLIGRPIAIGILENLKNGTDTLLSIKRNVSEYTYRQFLDYSQKFKRLPTVYSRPLNI